MKELNNRNFTGTKIIKKYVYICILINSGLYYIWKTLKDCINQWKHMQPWWHLSLTSNTIPSQAPLCASKVRCAIRTSKGIFSKTWVAHFQTPFLMILVMTQPIQRWIWGYWILWRSLIEIRKKMLWNLMVLNAIEGSLCHAIASLIHLYGG